MEIKWTAVLSGIVTIHGSRICVVTLAETCNQVSAVVCAAEKP